MTQPYYETMYILRPDIPEEEVDSHIAKYRDLVIEAGDHNGDGQQVGPLERAMRLSEDVIRYLTVKQTGPMPPPRALVATEVSAASPATAPAGATPAED